MKTQHTFWILLGLFIFMLAFTACSSEKSDDSGKLQTAAEQAVKPVDQSEQKVAQESLNKIDGQKKTIAASHVFVTYKDAPRKPKNVNRTKAEAFARIEEAQKKIKEGVDFAEVARSFSDCPTAPLGGYLGIFPEGRHSEEFTTAILAVEVGDISDIVELTHGYHIFKRQKTDTVPVSHILIMHTESKYKVGEITRTKEEAKKLIEEILQKLTSKKADFAELAVTYSDCSVSKLRGGFLGEVGYGKMFQSFEKAAFELEENEISAIVETGMGYHIITRISGKKVHARQIVLTHRESSAAVPEPSTRTKEEAKRLIEEILEKLKSKNADFAELARTYTESPIEKERGGDMGTFGLGWTPAPLEEAVFALKVNGIADIVETELGYHIIQRLPLDSE